MEGFERRIEALEAEIRTLRETMSRTSVVQNPFWFGIVLDTVAAATKPTDEYTEGKAELLNYDKLAVNRDDLKASGKALPFINRFADLTLDRGQLVLFARDWNKSIVITPACSAEYEDLLTLDEEGEPLDEYA